MKAKIPKAIREQVWIRSIGKRFESKCKTTWCRNRINVFDFQAGHDIPESKGGSLEITNLVPICSRCNLSMGSQHTFKEWCKKGKITSKWIVAIQSFLGICSDTTENVIALSPKPTSPKGKRSK